MFFVLLVMPFAFLGLWKLFREVGMYSDPYGDLPHMKVDASTMELDPILCAGIVKVLHLKERLKKCLEVHFVLPGLVLITEPLPDNFFGVGFNMGKRHTAAKWAEHLRKLKRWAVLIDVKYDKLLHVAYYFAVPKKEDVARAIWNGKFLSSFSPASPPVNLPFLPDLIRRLIGMSQRPGTFCLLLADFRHFFHTIPVSEALSLYFGVACDMGDGEGLKAFRWATLPMGWRHSPWVASSVGWGAILYHEDDDEELFLVPPGLKQLPTFIEIKGGGFITLYYDNLLVCSLDPNILERIENRLRRNFSPPSEEKGKGGFNIPLGYMTSYSHKALRSIHGKRPQYLGVNMWLSAKAGRDRDKPAFMWHQGEKIEKWKLLRPVWADIFSARNLASYIGKILWRHSITLRPLCALSPVIAILRRLATHRQATCSTWDDVNFALTPEESQVLTLHWDLVLTNKEHTGVVNEYDRVRVFLASDACDHSWGYLVFNEDGAKDFEKGHKFNNGLRARHIFIKELCAAIFAIRYILATKPKGVDIHIGVDNTAAASALRNLYSGNVMACELLDKLAVELTEHGAQLNVWGLRSEDNASDPVSRGKVATDEEVANCYKILLAQEKGHRLSVPEDYLRRVGVAHPELCEMDDTPIEPLLEAEDPMTGEANP